MPREVDADFIADHIHMFDRVQIPGGLWLPADVYYRSGDVFYRGNTETALHPLPVGSNLQASGLGIVRYARRTSRPRL